MSINVVVRIGTSRRYTETPNENRKDKIRGERNLLSAVLLRAILDLYGNANIDEYNRRSALVWLYEHIDLDKEFSFGWVSKHLDLDPHSLQVILRDIAKDPEKLAKCLYLMK